MTQANYSVTFDCNNHFDWEEFWCDINNINSYNEMINDIKHAAHEYGGGNVLIYDEDGEMVEELDICSKPTAIYKIDDVVTFLLDEKVYEGIIAIVDAFGTFFDNSEPYYDIYIQKDGKKVLVKHVRQSCIKRRD